jgi:hypothetical protein
MNIDFSESGAVPQPRDKVRIERLEARPYPDGWRVKITIDVTPFQERPSLEIRVRRGENHHIAELSVIETMHRHMEFTVHIRGVSSPAGEYVAEVDLYYDDPAAPQDRRASPFTVEPG